MRRQCALVLSDESATSTSSHIKIVVDAAGCYVADIAKILSGNDMFGGTETPSCFYVHTSHVLV